MNITLDQILDLTGPLEENNVRIKFRKFLKDNVRDIDQVQEMITNCLANSDEQHRLALWDLINLLGGYLSMKNDFDGIWKSPSGIKFVLEMETGNEPLNVTELLNHVNERDAKTTLQSESALGLCLTLDGEIQKAIVEAIMSHDENGQLRVISVTALITLVQMVKEYDLNHEDVLLLLLSSGPTIDPLIELMARFISKCKADAPSLEEIAYMLAPLSDEEAGSEEAIQGRLDQGQYYAYDFGTLTTVKKILKLWA